MTDKEHENRIDNDIAALLSDYSRLPEEAPGEYQEILQIAQSLALNDMSRQSHERAALRKRLLSRIPAQTQGEAWSPNQNKGNQTMHPKFRTLIFTVISTVTLILVLATTPTMQTFAQDLWQRVGPFIIVNKFAQTQEAVLTGATPTPIPGGGNISAQMPVPMATPLPVEGSGQEVLAPDASASPTPLPWTNEVEPIDNQIAEEKYGFQVLEPGYLPDAYSLIEHQVNRTQDDSLVSIYVYTTTSTAFDAPYLSIQQSTFEDKAPIEFMVGDANVSQVEVRGTTGTYIEDARLMTVRDEAGNNITLPVNYLMWEEGSNFFVIDTTQLAQNEMIRIAESLH
jgi:hypothetical protein